MVKIEEKLQDLLLKEVRVFHKWHQVLDQKASDCQALIFRDTCDFFSIVTVLHDEVFEKVHELDASVEIVMYAAIWLINSQVGYI